MLLFEYIATMVFSSQTVQRNARHKMTPMLIMTVIIVKVKKFVCLDGLEKLQTVLNTAYHNITNMDISNAQELEIKFV